MSIELSLRLALQQLVEAIEYTPMGVRGIKAVANARKELTAIQQADAKTPSTDPMLATEVKPRPLGYSLNDYHRAGFDGPLHATWQDKPHRLLYDLIAAVAYYAQEGNRTHPAPGVPEGWSDRHMRVAAFALRRFADASWECSDEAAQKSYMGDPSDYKAFQSDAKDAEDARAILLTAARAKGGA